jgi:transketolase
MRTAFINQLIEEAKTDEKIFLLVGDLGFSVVEQFVDLYPSRFINVGIAEQNMVGIASGLAMEGYTVFIYSIGNFPTLRCMEQIRYDVCYHGLNVKIVAVGSGFSYGPLGPSHHATEELGMLRTLPNLVVCSPGDPLETKAVTSFCVSYKGPCYLRLGKAGESIVHIEPVGKLLLGQILEIIKGEQVAIFSTGSIIKYVCDFIDNANLGSSVFSFPFVNPIDKKLLLQILKNHDKVITIEEHQSNGGFGSAILELVNDLIEDGSLFPAPKIKRIAIPGKFYSVAGTQDYLRLLAGLKLEIEDFNI